MIFSKSRINCYLNCPLQFKWNYIDRIPQPPNIYMERGKDVHKIYENFFKHVNKQTYINDFLPILMNLAGDNKNQYAIFLVQIAKIESRRKVKAYRFRPSATEIGVTAKYVESIRHEPIHMRGFIDCIEKIGDNEFAVIDYKTSNITKIDEYMFELVMYAYMMKQRYPNYNFTTVKIHALTNGKVLEAKIDQTDIDKMLKIVKEVKENIEQEKFFKRENKYCGNCPYLKKCVKATRDGTI